jgi:hypothetical protein
MNLLNSQAHEQAEGEQRSSQRRALHVVGRMVWKDAKGTTRFNSVVIRDLSETGAYVESVAGAPIPLYRLVSLQAERLQPDAQPLPAVLRQGKILSAIYRVGPARAATGAPEGYALRLLLEPRRHGSDARGAADFQIATA